MALSRYDLITVRLDCISSHIHTRAVHLHVQLYVPKDNLVGRNSDCDIAKPEIIKAVRKSINHTLTSNKCAVFILIIPDTHSWEYITAY